MKNMKVTIVLFLLCGLLLAGGCGNVCLWGDAMTAAETSALDAHQAAKRAAADPNMPAWGKAYTAENYRHWRSMVRSAKNDADWGPRLDGETVGK